LDAAVAALDVFMNGDAANPGYNNMTDDEKNQAESRKSELEGEE
jgi:hypothetical protein